MQASECSRADPADREPDRFPWWRGPPCPLAFDRSRARHLEAHRVAHQYDVIRECRIARVAEFELGETALAFAIHRDRHVQRDRRRAMHVGQAGIERDREARSAKTVARADEIDRGNALPTKSEARAEPWNPRD